LATKVDGGLEVHDAFEDAAFEGRLVRTAKKPSTALSQLAEVFEWDRRSR
jgi:hypothetical protein